MSDDRKITNTGAHKPPFNPRLEAAQQFAQRGWSVFPAEIAGKAPYTRLLPARNPEKPKRADSNPATFLPFCEEPASAEQVAQWWTGQPQANVAVLTRASGLLVVDVDLHKVSPERRAALLEAMAPTPYIVETPSGGRHYYYRHPPEPLLPVTQKAHRYSECIDVQSGNLYVVAPNSRTTAGEYRWLGGASMPTGPLPPAPAWTIADECDPNKQRVLSDDPGCDWYALAWGYDIPENGDPLQGVMGRKQHIRSMALYHARKGDPVTRTMVVLSGWNQYRCKPPLKTQEVHRLVHVMYKHHHEDMGTDESDSVTLRVPSRSLPVDSLRVAPILWEWSCYTSGVMRIDQDLTCFTALVGASIAAAGKYTLEIEGIPVERWSPPVLLWGVAVASSGSKKSALIRQVNTALEPTHEVLAATAARFNAELDARKTLLTSALNEAKKALSHASAERRDQASRIISAMTLEIRSLPSEIPSVWMLGDVTPEKMQELLGELGWLALVSEEGDDVLGGFFGRYGNGSNFNSLLKAFDRGSTTTARIGRGVSVMNDAMAGVLLATQPTGLSGLVTHEASDRGLTARILWCIPRPDAPKYLEPPSTDEKEHARASKKFEALLRSIYFGGRGKASTALKEAQQYRPAYEEDAVPNFDLSELEPEPSDEKKGRGRPPKPLITPSSRKLVPPVLRERERLVITYAAQEPADELHTVLKKGAELGGDWYLAQAWAHKGREHAFRIAAVLALAASEGEAREVGREFVEAACTLVRDYFLPQCAVAADLMTHPAEAAKCMHLLKRFADRGEFTASEVASELSIGSKAAEHLVHWLADRGALKVTKSGRKLTCSMLPNVRY